MIHIENDDPIECYRQIFALKKREPLSITTRLENLNIDFLAKYQEKFHWHMQDSFRSLMTPDIRDERFEFSYNDRIHKHFGVDQTEYVFNNLNGRENASRNVITTWDPPMDLIYSGERIPCLLLISFYVNDQELDMSVVFRMRDMVRRLIPNWNALWLFQKEGCKFLKKKMGKINDISLGWFYKTDDWLKIRHLLETEKPLNINLEAPLGEAN